MHLPVKTIPILILFFEACLAIATVGATERPRTTSLFNGETLDGWTTADGKPVTKGWEAADGTLHRKSRGGHIYYHKPLGDFRLAFEWKISSGGNSGVKYRVQRYGKRLLGCEYQLLDDRDRKPGKGTAAALYSIYPPASDRQLKPVGQWNTAQIVVDGTKFEHWLNGKKVVSADTSSDEWRQRLANSKFAPHKRFSQNAIGLLMLQDHGREVWFRNLQLTPLTDSP